MNSAIIIDISENGASLDDGKQECKKDVIGVKKNYNDDIVRFYHDSKNPSPLSIQLQKENAKNHEINILRKMSKNFLSGYDKHNAIYALTLFVKRRLLIVNSSNVSEKITYPNCIKNVLYEAVLEITIPIAKIRSKKYCAESRTSNDAELSVALIVLEELFKFDIIKEASIELYCRGRKKFLNPALSLSKGMRFLLEDRTDNTFLSKMNKLEILYSKSSINCNDTSIILSNEKFVKNYPQNSQLEEIIKF
uniref:Uncharacterized protein n=1 Tax=Meloidogyne enterolobii TaxID=390850 RepID=A0A6V7VX01_MELEN|nr:unnamed protein product [Meloidogyne enterolobii]